MQTRFVGAMAVLLLSSLAQAQDVDVPNNLTMANSTGLTVGNVLKDGVPFLHNFGTSNTFLGSGAGNFTMTGSDNTATGFGALGSDDAGSRNTATGRDALRSNTTGSENTANGSGALRSNTVGINNTATGVNALFQNTDGRANTATGWAALFSNTIGNNNTASGSGALRSNTLGSANTATGVAALLSNTTGNENTAIGVDALVSNTTGDNNTANGAGALYGNTTGNFNTGTGHGTLGSNSTGSFNTALGWEADVSLGDLSNATAIGAGAVADASNKIRFGNTQVSVIEGQVPYTYTSDRNQKENFRAVDADEVLTKLRRLSVTSWNYKGQDAKQFRHYGPMAQDFYAAFGHDAVGTIGTPTTITSGDLDGILMVAAQALEKRTVEQRKRIDALTAENADLKARIEALERRVGGYALTRAE